MTTAPALQGSARSTRHPARRFLLVVLALSLLAVLLCWTGVANPRLGLSTDTGRFDILDRTGHVEVVLTNHAATPVDVIAVAVDGQGVVTTSSGPADGSSFPTALGPGDSERLIVSFEVDDCRPDSRFERQPRIMVTARTAVGIEREVAVGDRGRDPLMGMGTCPTTG